MLSLLLTLLFCFQELHLLPEAFEELVLAPLVRGVSSFGASFSDSFNSSLESSTPITTSDVTSCFTSLAEIPAGARNQSRLQQIQLRYLIFYAKAHNSLTNFHYFLSFFSFIYKQTQAKSHCAIYDKTEKFRKSIHSHLSLSY